MLHSSGLNTGQASSESVQKRMATVKQHEGRRGFPSSDPRERPIDLVSMTQNTRRPGGQRGGLGSEAGGGHIDLVKVTENYSGALQAADRRVQHASTDPALARALAEKAELERQLKVWMSCLLMILHCSWHLHHCFIGAWLFQTRSLCGSPSQLCCICSNLAAPGHLLCLCLLAANQAVSSICKPFSQVSAYQSVITWEDSVPGHQQCLV